MNDTAPWARSRAVLLGAWDYNHLPPVPAARHSLNRMAALLTGPLCEWPAQRISVIPDAPHRGNLPDQLMYLFHDVTDVALFYFVGHGQLHGDELCLALTESPNAGPRRLTTGLQFADVREALRECDAHTKIVILDCCFSGIITQPQHTLGHVDVIERASGTGAFVMAASGAYQTAWHEPDQGTGNPQTYFTKYLINTIEQGLPDGPDGLPLRVIFDRTADALARDHLPEPTRSVRHNADHFILARNAALLSATPPQEPTPLRWEPATPPPDTAVVPASPVPAPVQPVLFQLTRRQRASVASWISPFLMICVGLVIWPSGVIFPTGGFFGIVVFVAGLVSNWRAALFLTQDGVYFRSWKTKFIGWREIKEVQARRYPGNRIVKFVLGNRSKLSPVPADGWGVRDREFDQKVQLIQEWHARFGSPELWMPGTRPAERTPRWAARATARHRPGPPAQSGQ